MIRPEIDLELSIKALEVYGIEPNIIKSMLSNLNKVVKKNDLSHVVSNPLPVLVTEEYPNEWIASLKGIRGMIATGETEEEAISALMTSVKVMLLYNRQ